MRVPPDFTVDVRRDGETVVVIPAGELDIATIPVLRSALRMHRESPELVLDLRRVSFLDSAGLALVLEEHLRAERERVKFRVVRGQDLVHQVFEMTGLSRRLVWADDMAAAGDAGSRGA